MLLVTPQRKGQLLSSTNSLTMLNLQRFSIVARTQGQSCKKWPIPIRGAPFWVCLGSSWGPCKSRSPSHGRDDCPHLLRSFSKASSCKLVKETTYPFAHQLLDFCPAVPASKANGCVITSPPVVSKDNIMDKIDAEMLGNILPDFLTTESVTPDLLTLLGFQPRQDMAKAGHIPIHKPRKLRGRASPKSYSYEPLPTKTSIRILKVTPEPLDPGASLGTLKEEMKAPIRCQMKVVDLEDGPEYEALSYTWGDPLVFYRFKEDVMSREEWYTPCFTIYVNDQPVSVTANLYTALMARQVGVRALDSPSAPRLAPAAQRAKYRPKSYIWVDALCINQSDLEERSAQVSLMPRIYRNASTTVIWLGGDEETSLDSVGLLHEVSNWDGEQYVRAVSKLKGTPLFGKSAASAYQGLPIRAPTMLNWLSLYCFFNRSWFKRAWVVQELGLSRNAIFAVGGRFFQLELPFFMLKFLRDTGLHGQLDVFGRSMYGEDSELENDNPFRLHRSQPSKMWNSTHFVMMVNLMAGHGYSSNRIGRSEEAKPAPLVDLLSNFQGTEASDPRDKVYAFLGASGDFSAFPSKGTGNKLGVQLLPNYRLSVEDVYIDTAKAIIQAYNCLNILSHVEDMSYRKLQNLPSWVPDYSSEGFPSSLGIILDWHEPWNASDGIGPMHCVFQTNNSLEVRGVKAGLVAETAVIGKGPETDGRLFKDLARFLLKLPERSEIPSPPLTERLKQFRADKTPKTDDGFVSTWAGRFLHSGRGTQTPESSLSTELASATHPQSRSEVFWRTLLANYFNSQYPAHASCGRMIHYLQRKEIIDGLEKLTQGVLDDKAKEIRDSLVQEYEELEQLRSPAEQELSNNKAQPTHLEFQELKSAIRKHGRYPCRVTLRAVATAHNKLRQALETSTEGVNTALETDVMAQIQPATFAKKLFRTDHGHLGMGHASARPGDEAWILCGAPTPFLLRPLGDGRYRLVGETYVHGLMDGVGLLMPHLVDRVGLLTIV
jgi:hypothetical protein